MKKILLGLLALVLFASISCAVPLGQGLGDYFPAGIEVVGGGITGSLESYSAEILSAGDDSMENNDTISFIFSFEPSKIILIWNGICQHDTTNEPGWGSGSTYITIAGTDTITHTLNRAGHYDNNGNWVFTSDSDDATNITYILGGNDGSDTGSQIGTATWTTATKTLLITFTTANAAAADTRIGIKAIAIR